MALLTVAGGIGLWSNRWYSEQANGRPGGTTVVVTVKPGTGLGAITSTLVSDGVLAGSSAFRIQALVDGSPHINPGTFAFHRSESFAEVRRQLAGQTDVFPVVVLPGFSLAEIAQAVGDIPGHSTASFYRLATAGTVRSEYEPTASQSLEGLVATGTYVVVPGETDTQILTKMVGQFDAEATSDHLSTDAAALGVTPYQATIVASIVQKEGVYSENLGPVARVVYNRLQADMLLQMDSTVLYGEGRDGGPVTVADESTVNPYNTYLNYGLPPTPTCAFSKSSLKAALNPPAGDWLYFELVSPDGTESFETTLAAHDADITLAHSRGLP